LREKGFEVMIKKFDKIKNVCKNKNKKITIIKKFIEKE